MKELGERSMGCDGEGREMGDDERRDCTAGAMEDWSGWEGGSTGCLGDDCNSAEKFRMKLPVIRTLSGGHLLEHMILKERSDLFF